MVVTHLDFSYFHVCYNISRRFLVVVGLDCRLSNTTDWPRIKNKLNTGTPVCTVTGRTTTYA